MVDALKHFNFMKVFEWETWLPVVLSGFSRL
ncbi:hypothetical protein PLUTE_b6013 [Pseudoalteromonas luteoviolacea DSM 6061]|nr:hypothetical protein [Pseudoalteromonas luteoviolacea DSM 6061]